MLQCLMNKDEAAWEQKRFIIATVNSFLMNVFLVLINFEVFVLVTLLCSILQNAKKSAKETVHHTPHRKSIN